MRPGHKCQFARHLRRRATDAERRLWRCLRHRALGGFKFRRQHPIGRYIADFACIQARLVVELDGGQHAAAPADAARTRVLQGQGYCVLRFWNNDVLARPQAVLGQILAALRVRSRADRLS